MSAGMICWFEEFTTDSFGDELEKLSGLGWLKGSAVPHLDGEKDRFPTYAKLIENNEISEGIGLDDGVGALYLNESLDECVSSRPNARGFYFGKEDYKLKVEPLSVKYLGA
jgi:peptidase E